VTTGIEPVADLGPVISKQPKECTAVLMSLVLDGCGIKVSQNVF